MPETEIPVAMRYLEDASLLLSLCRSFQGIAASDNREILPYFNSVLRGQLRDRDARNLERILSAEKLQPVARSGVNDKAQRIKGVYHLAAAASMRRY